MNAPPICENRAGDLSRLARGRMNRPLFHADWLDVVFLHYAVPTQVLRSRVPYDLDEWEGDSFVSLVLFTLSDLRTDFLTGVGQRLLRPVSDHLFLNARTYVRGGGESGIYFLAEWLSKALPVPLGGPLFGLPYHHGHFDCRHHVNEAAITGEVHGRNGQLSYRGNTLSPAEYAPCRADSLDQFLLERYVAFTRWRGIKRYFRVWHEPWPVTSLNAHVKETSLLRQTGDWIEHARLTSAHYSPGARDVWLGHTQFL